MSGAKWEDTKNITNNRKERYMPTSQFNEEIQKIEETIVDNVKKFGEVQINVPDDKSDIVPDVILMRADFPRWIQQGKSEQWLLTDGVDVFGHMLPLSSKPKCAIVLYPNYTVGQEFEVYSMPCNWMITIDFDKFIESGKIVPDDVHAISHKSLAVEYMMDGGQ